MVAGLDTGGTTINATVLDAAGEFLIQEMAETPSCVREGPDKAVEALAGALLVALSGLASRSGPCAPSAWTRRAQSPPRA